MIIRLVAASALAMEIAIHADLAPDHLREVPYVGVGFVLAAVLLSLALFGVLADRPRGWLLGVALCVGMGVLFVASRTIGLPGFREAWSSDGGLGLAALPAEAVFIGCAIIASRQAQGDGLVGLLVRGAAGAPAGHRGGRCGCARRASWWAKSGPGECRDLVEASGPEHRDWQETTPGA